MMLMALVRVTRPAYALRLSCPYLVTLYYLRDGMMRGHWQTDLLSAASLSLVLAGGYAANDAADVRYDRLKPHPGPVATGQAPAWLAGLVGLMLVVVGCLLSVVLGQPVFTLCLVAVAGVLLAYDLVSKRVGLWKEVIVGVLMASTYILAAAHTEGIVAQRAATIPFFAVWMLLSTVAYEILSDVRDRRSDRVGGGGPAAIHAHPRRWMYIAEAFMVAGALSLLGPAFLGCGIAYRITLPLAVGIPLVRGLRAQGAKAKMAWVIWEFLGVGVSTTADVLLPS